MFAREVAYFVRDEIAAMPALSPVRVTGDPANRVNIIFAGDGYRASEIETVYKNHVDSAVSYFFDGGPLSEPFTRYNGFFNIYRANLVSAESGADNPPLGIFRNTALDASYWFDGQTERLLYVNDAKTSDAVGGALAGTGISSDLVLVSVNDTRYGGGGGQYAVFAGGNPSAYEIALHEVGHSFAGLADEYTEFPDNTVWDGGEPGVPDLTIDSTGAKWSQWLGYEQPGVGEIGAYEGGNRFYELGIFRPSLTSKMRELGFPFDAVSREQFILNFYEKVDPIDGHTPNESTIVDSDRVRVRVIDQDVIDVRWSVDGRTVLDGNATTFDLSNNGFGLGTFEVAAVAYDQTDWARIHPELTRQRIEWTFVEPTGATTESDSLTGTSLSDKIFARAGNDLVSGLDASDTLGGGAGNDRLHGGDGSDVVSGDNGNDRLFGDSGNDRLFGRAGDDRLYGGVGADRMQGGTGNDSYNVDRAADVVDEEPGAGTDIVHSSIAYTLLANFENLTLTGSAVHGAGNELNNTIRGNDAANELDGLRGADVLYGGLGPDHLTGGSGPDRFDFNSAAECGRGAGRDIITDFLGSEGDEIDLRSIDANTAVSGDQAFTFIGANSFTGAAGQLRFSGDICRGDIDGDRGADFELQILGSSSMQATDFLL